VRLFIIRAEDIDLGKAYLNRPLQLKKARTVVLLPPMIEAQLKDLAGRYKGWLFPSYIGEHISSQQVKNDS
jgi:hypothetical protein